MTRPATPAIDPDEAHEALLLERLQRPGSIRPLADAVERACSEQVRSGVPRADDQRLLITGERVVEPTELKQRVTEVHQCRHIGRPQRQRALVMWDRFFRPAALLQGDGEIHVRLSEIRP